MSASGYGTRAVSGQIPAGSGRSAYQVIGCTNRAGLDKNNFEAGVDLRPLGSVSAVRTRTWTTRRNGVVSSWANNHIARVKLGDATTGSVVIRGINSLSRAFHGRTGFHAKTATSIATIAVDPDGAGPLPRQQQRIPTAGDPLLIPGLVRIALGPKAKDATASGAWAKADAVRIKFLPTSSVVYLAHSHATIHSGVVSALFSGSAYASRVKAADAHVRSKMTPYIVMPCQGTAGKVIRQDIARVNPQGLVIRGLSATQRATQTQNKANAWEQGHVARLNVGGGSIVATGVVGRANVHFVRGQGITKNIRGSSLATLTINGTTRQFPHSGVITVPGLAKLERNVVTRTASSITVTALRVTLLDGTGAVIHLGHARVGIKRSGL